jgi:leucine dehydrogenase
LKECFGTDSPEGKTIAIQGIGSVGAILADYLFWAGAKLIIADVDESALQRCAKKTGATIVSIEDIVTVPCDVFAPCALGGVLNAKNISLLQAKAVAGAANNQLLLEEDAELLEKRGILYAPDFVINAGGLLNVSLEVSPSGYDPRLARIQCHAIYDTLLAIYKIAKTQNISTHRAALFLAEDRVRQKQGKRTIPPVFHHSKASK